jgi:hypothetical protein
VFGSYQHANREFGRIKFPDFEPASYEPKSKFYEALAAAGFIVPESGDVPPAAAAPPTADLNDQIPF